MRDQTGCSQVIKLGSRDHHEEKCEYSHAVCPYGGDQCGVLRKRDFDDHLTKCSRVPCPFSDFGMLAADHLTDFVVATKLAKTVLFVFV